MLTSYTVELIITGITSSLHNDCSRQHILDNKVEFSNYIYNNMYNVFIVIIETKDTGLLEELFYAWYSMHKAKEIKEEETYNGLYSNPYALFGIEEPRVNYPTMEEYFSSCPKKCDKEHPSSENLYD